MRSVLFLLLTSTMLLAAPDGPKLYQAQCAKCHGDQGQGVAKKYAKPLAGEMAVPQLAEIVRKTMPEDAPESLTKEESTAIATYMNEAFYGPTAQQKNKPARIDLSRLTVNQYRHAVSDLIGSFRWNSSRWIDGGKGLKAEYFGGRGYGNKQLDRNDLQVKFNFGTNLPEGYKSTDPEFSIRWTGSVLVPETGEYSLIVKSDQAVKLWFNENDPPVIIATVKSGDTKEYIANLMLTGGRVYNVKLEFSKALQGVKDKKPKPTAAFVELCWKTPHGGAEVIPQRYLSPNWVPEQHRVGVTFPPDDKSLGWERGTAVSKEWANATTDGALDAANYVVKHLYNLAEIDPKLSAEKKLPMLKAFAEKFVERAFCRPLTPELKELYIERAFKLGNGSEEATFQRIVLLTLKSSRFLFREVTEAGDSFDVASRLSFALWDSLPDEDLRTAARQGKLTTVEQVKAQANRMMADPRASTKMRSLLLHWLRLDNEKDIAKNLKLYPGFDATVLGDLRESLLRSLDELVSSKEADFKQFFTADEFYLNGKLSTYYKANLPAEAPMTKAKLDNGTRKGLLAHPYLLAANAYADQSSPIHRGVFLAKGVLGTGLKPPNEAFSPFSADAHPMLNTRERIELQTKGPNCQTCHTVINNLGFTLESFDAIGAFREKDNNKPVNTVGKFLARDGKEHTFADSSELNTYLKDSLDVHAAFAEQLFHHLVHQPMLAYGPTTRDGLVKSFATGNFNMKTLAAEIATIGAMKSRTK